MMETLEPTTTWALATLFVTTVLPQVAAIFGVPKWIKGVSVLNLIFKAIAGNYGKAENKDG